MRTILGGTRHVIALAVFATFLAAALLLLGSAVAAVRLVWNEVADGNLDNVTVHHVDHLAVQVVQLTDSILLGTVLYIISLSLYQLFIDDSIPVPKWMRVHDLMELKRDLISVTVVLLAVTFLGEVVDRSTDDNVLPLGVAIAAVIIALALFTWLNPRERDEH
ncbi:MAG: YqhA family protein [Thermomicrobiales bacterium]|nr:YqhA family protein [Thermomicrobiales bacterium]